MGALFSNRYLDALAKTVLFFGVTHLAVLSYAALRGNVDALNAFSIVSLNLVMPELGKGLINFALSYCMVLGVYIVMRLFPTRFLKKVLAGR